MPLRLLAVLLLVCVPALAHAWGELGHRAIGEAVQTQLDEATREAIARIVNPGQPLAEGTLDVERLYLRPLLDAGYTGPVLLHTFGLAQSADTHLEQSLARWRQMIATR